jgi:PKD repeat protein
MKKINYLITGLLVFFAALPVQQAHAQLNCGTDAQTRKLTQNDPSYQARKAAFDAYMKDYIAAQKAGRTTAPAARSTSSATYVIPIVFHIIHEYGAENISDAQVQDAVAILNRDYQKLNPDTAGVITPFVPLIGDMDVEFRLAKIDPDGNCTNGIDRIYSHETRVGDDFSKLNPWPRYRYLNVWVVKTMENGVAGYAYYPSAVDQGFGYVIDGVIILQDYIGSIGTSSPSHSRALTHEIGHYLGLPHVWGSNNNPGQVCGDDGFLDTPETKGWTSCPTAVAPNYTAWRVCDTGTVENVQNYMDYSYCSKMFTIDQSFGMQASLNSPTAARSTLWSPANLAAAGVDGTTYPPCTPVTDFNANTCMVCEGSTVNYSDESWNGPVTSRQWQFDGGTPGTSTTTAPVVTYNTAGTWATHLTTSNTTGSSSASKWNYIYVSPGTSDFTGTYAEDFESGSLSHWFNFNYENNNSDWHVVSNAGYNSTHSLMLDAFGTDGYVRDEIVTPSIDLTYTTAMTLNFKYAGATRTTNDSITDVLKVYSSTNCGKNWTLRKTISGNNLITAGYCGNAFVPSQQSFWTQASVPLSTSQLAQPRVRFKFEYISGSYSNNFYIDDINITGVVGQEEIVNHDFNLQVYPNPATEEATVAYNLVKENKIALTLTDASGRVVWQQQPEMQAAGEHRVTLGKNAQHLAAGFYFLTIDDGHTKTTRKLSWM